MIERIAILGTGLLGTSVGLALRAAGYRGEISGWNRTPEQAQIALAMGAIDSFAHHMLEVGRRCDVVLLAVPIHATIDFMEQLSGLLGPHQLVTDVGSTKREIAAAASRLYNRPGRAAFLPGHPMAGKEQGGASLADANLFRGATWLFTYLEDTKGTGLSPHDDKQSGSGALTPEAISARAAQLMREWREWVAKFGAKIVDLDPTRHDELVAWVSHLPQFVSTALGALLEDQVGDAPELKEVCGRALREMTRLAASPYSMWRDIAHTNTAQIEAVLHAFEQRLAHLRENLRTPALRDEFEQANRFRRD
ncbi:MAG: prephenate dehydrogenase/arogenate dehydrogenase family protein [Terracidiphilus sp.]